MNKLPSEKIWEIIKQRFGNNPVELPQAIMFYLDQQSLLEAKPKEVCCGYGSNSVPPKPPFNEVSRASGVAHSIVASMKPQESKEECPKDCKAEIHNK